MVNEKRRPQKFLKLINDGKIQKKKDRINNRNYVIYTKKNKHEKIGSIIPIIFKEKPMLGIITNIISHKCKVTVIRRAKINFYKDRERYIEWNGKKYKIFLADNGKAIFLADAKIIDIKIDGDWYVQIGDRKNKNIIREWRQDDFADIPDIIPKKDYLFDPKLGEFVLDYQKIQKELKLEKDKIEEFLKK